MTRLLFQHFDRFQRFHADYSRRTRRANHFFAFLDFASCLSTPNVTSPAGGSATRARSRSAPLARLDRALSSSVSRYANVFFDR